MNESDNIGGLEYKVRWGSDYYYLVFFCDIGFNMWVKIFEFVLIY